MSNLVRYNWFMPNKYYKISFKLKKKRETFAFIGKKKINRELYSHFKIISIETK